MNLAVITSAENMWICLRIVSLSSLQRIMLTRCRTASWKCLSILDVITGLWGLTMGRHYVGFEVLTAIATMLVPSSAYFSALKMEAICSSETSDDFQRTTRRYISKACHLLSRWFLARLIFLPWRWRQYVPPKRRMTFNGQHGVI
jgi:hypothetical protein